MPSKVEIKKLTEQQAKTALLYLLEATYNTPCGILWNKKIDEALKKAVK